MKELKTLSYKTKDIEPTPPERIKVELAGRFFVARCPNDYEFFKLIPKLRDLEKDPTSFDIVEILENFFDPEDARTIDREASGASASISLTRDLMPCLEALVDHYQPEVQDRFKEIQKSVSVPKGR